MSFLLGQNNMRNAGKISGSEQSQPAPITWMSDEKLTSLLLIQLLVFERYVLVERLRHKSCIKL